MSMEAYTYGLIGVMALGILIFKLRIAVVSFIWGILSFGIAGIALQHDNFVAFHPLLQICCAILGIALALHSIHLYRGGG